MTSVEDQRFGGASSESGDERHLAMAVAQSKVIFYTANAMGDFPLNYISENVETLTGHTAAHMLSGTAYRDGHIHPDDLPGYRQACQSAIAGGGASCQYRLRLADGGTRWYRDELSLPPGDGMVLTGCMIDISAEMAVAEGQRELLRAYQGAVENIDGGFCVTDCDDRVIACNTMLAKSTGFGPEHFIGRPRRHLVQVILPKIEIFDGERTEQTAAWIDKIFDRISQPSGRGLELKMAAGYWVRATFAPTLEGGQIILITDINARKKLEREMRESAERFRMLVESHPLPVVLIDVKTGAVLYESPAASALLGHEWSPDVDFKVQDMYADPEEREQVVAELRRDGELRNRRIRQRRDDGSLYWISVTSRLTMYEGREVNITSIVDVTEEQERDIALARAHETLEDAIESLSEGFALFDQDDRLVTFNSRFCEFNAICHDLVRPGTRFDDLIRTGTERGQYYGDKAEIEQFLESHLADREQGRARFGFDYRLANGDWFQYSSQPTRQGGMVVTLTDISKSREMQRALRESEASVRQILEGCPAPITVSRGHDSIILYESPASKKLFRRGGEGDNKVARDYWADKSDRDGIWAELQQSGLVQDRTIQFVDGDGNPFWASYSARLVENQGEQMIVSAILDLTEYRALEEEMVRQREVLHVSEKMVAMGELLASVSHELNNPLSVVVGQALLLQETTTDEAVAARAERIVSSADRCARIGKKRVYRQEFEHREGARSTWLEISLRAYDEDGIYAVIECRDMTAQKRAEYMLESYSDVSERNTRELQKEKDRVERLLLNIMPRSVYEEMKDYGTVTPKRYDSATILLLDFVDFTEMAVSREPGELVSELNDIFSAFDRIVEMFGCERIKTMGDAYMAVAGIPEASPDHAADMARVALRLRRYLDRRNAAHTRTWDCRIGIATGPVIGSIVGIQKYVYDIFGPGVNLAARMEGMSEPMRITLSSDTYDLIKNDFIFEEQGFREVKGFGEMEMFFLEGERERTSIRRENLI